jgi:hypothetical protein
MIRRPAIVLNSKTIIISRQHLWQAVITVGLLYLSVEQFLILMVAMVVNKRTLL